MRTVWISTVLIVLLVGSGHTSTSYAAPNLGPEAPAGLIIVNTAEDELDADGDCSLREAITAANLGAPVDACPAGAGDNTIILPAGRYVLRLAGGSEDGNLTGDLDLHSNITLVGAGADATIIDGNRIDRVLDIYADARVVLSGVTFTNGKSPDGVNADYPMVGGNAEPGGGVRTFGDLWLFGCTVAGNRAGQGGTGGRYGGEGGDGGGIYNRGDLTVQMSDIAQNEAGAGGFFLSGPCGAYARGGNGGGVWNDGMLVTLNSTISANRAGRGSYDGGGAGGGLWSARTLIGANNTITANQSGLHADGGGIWSSGTLTMTNTTISANRAGAGGSGGGIANTGYLTLTQTTLSTNLAGDGIGRGKCYGDVPGGDGGAIYNSGTLSIADSTLSGNRSGSGGVSQWDLSIYNGGSGGGIANAGIARVSYSTITANATGVRGGDSATISPDADGGGIYNQAGGQLISRGLLLGGNTAARNGNDCFGSLSPHRYNLIQDASHCTLTGDLSGNIIGQNPRLEPLADNGGPTWTHALSNDSAAIDHADCRGLDGTLLTTDQRGKPRPLGHACDIGAVEGWALTRLPFIAK